MWYGIFAGLRAGNLAFLKRVPMKELGRQIRTGKVKTGVREMKQFRQNPWKTGAAIFIFLLIGLDVFRRGIHTEHSVFAAVAVGLLKAAENKKEEVE